MSEARLPTMVLDLRSIVGATATVTSPATVTNGASVELDVTADPGSATMIHYHPEQEETYQVLEGTLDVFRDGRWQAVPAGETLTVSPGAIHDFRNASKAPGRFLNVHRPALAFQEHLETLDRLSRSGKIQGSKDLRSLIYLSVSAVKHRPDVPIKPPPWVMGTLAFIGRRLGYTLDDDVAGGGQMAS